jgi:coenzyme F420-reducing hydrogenase beta subunit
MVWQGQAEVGRQLWTGVVTGIAVQMLESGAVNAVVCVQIDPNDRWVCCMTRNTGLLRCKCSRRGADVSC